MAMFLLPSNQSLICKQKRNQFTILCSKDLQWVVFHQFYLYALMLPLLSMNFGFNRLQLLRGYSQLAVVHENLFIAPANTGIVASQRLQILLFYYQSRLLLNLSSSNPHKISTLVYHTSRSLQNSSLNGYSILLNQEYLLINQHQYCHCRPSKKNIIRQLIPILLGNCPHIHKPYFLLPEHLHSKYLYLRYRRSFLQPIKTLHIILKLLTSLNLRQYSLINMRQRKDRHNTHLQSEFECFNHTLYIAKNMIDNPYPSQISIIFVQIIDIKC